jgi:hypothetical protein
MITKSKLAYGLASLLLGVTFFALPSDAAQPILSTNALTFENLGLSPGGTHMPTNYGGFKWFNSNWHYMSLGAVSTNTYLALSGTATTMVSSGGEDFYFDGADYWSRRGADANGSFYFILHHDGVLVYDGREDNDGRQRFTGVPQHFTANYTGLVDTVAAVFTQGGDDWDHLAMDNFQFRSSRAVPPAPQLEAARLPEGFQLRFVGQADQGYGIEACADLSAGAWSRIDTVATDAAGAGQFTDTNANLGQQFYRAVFP